MFIPKPHRLTAALALIAIVPAQSAVPVSTTAAVNITPLRLDFTPGQGEGQLEVQNQASVPLAIQVRVFAWTQEQGENRYQPSAEFVISPSIVRIGPGLTQTLHVIAAAKTPASIEKSYRIVVDQLPQTVQQVAGAAQTRVRLTLPLFVASAGKATPSLSYAVAGKQLTVTNHGDHVGVLAGLRVKQGPRTIDMSAINAPPYVLANSSVTFNLAQPVDCQGPPPTVSGQLDRNAFDAAASSTCS